MDKLAGQSKVKLDWRHSIVDLMKLLALDSSLAARKTLAGELHYTGNTDELGDDERLPAQASDGKTRRERRQGARRTETLNAKRVAL